MDIFPLWLSINTARMNKKRSVRPNQNNAFPTSGKCMSDPDMFHIASSAILQGSQTRSIGLSSSFHRLFFNNRPFDPLAGAPSKRRYKCRLAQDYFEGSLHPFSASCPSRRACIHSRYKGSAACGVLKWVCSPGSLTRVTFAPSAHICS